MPVIDPRLWPTVKGGEPTRLYPLGHGASIKLTDAQARQRGYLPPEPVQANDPDAKKEPLVNNKRRRVASNKQAPPGPEEPQEAEE